MTSRWIALLCLGLVLAAGPIGCGPKPETKEDRKTECSYVLPQTRENIQDYVEYTGRTAAVNSVDIKARVTGFLLDSQWLDLPEIGARTVGSLASPVGHGPLLAASVLVPGRASLFKEGEVVHQGQKLFLIDPRPYDAQLKQAEAQVGLYEAQVKLTEATYNQAVDVAKKNPKTFSDLQLRTYEAQKDEARAGLNAARASLEIYRINKNYTTVTSPISGVVGRTNQTPGNVII
jgi:multidrug efflux system membrane fusion protein